MGVMRCLLGLMIWFVVPSTAFAGCIPNEKPGRGWENLKVILECMEKEAAQAVPKGTIGFFNLSECPTGWERADELTGRYVVGLNPQYPRDVGAYVGKALENKEGRAAGEHTHDFSEIGLAHKGNVNEGLETSWNSNSNVRLNVNSGRTKPTPENAGVTNAPYVQLSACRKKGE